MAKIENIDFLEEILKNPAYGKHRISRPMRIVAPIAE